MENGGGKALSYTEEEFTWKLNTTMKCLRINYASYLLPPRSGRPHALPSHSRQSRYLKAMRGEKHRGIRKHQLDRREPTRGGGEK